MRLYRPWTGWIGLAGMVLGAGFPGAQFGHPGPRNYLNHWWAIPILIPCLWAVSVTCGAV